MSAGSSASRSATSPTPAEKKKSKEQEWAATANVAEAKIKAAQPVEVAHAICMIEFPSTQLLFNRSLHFPVSAPSLLLRVISIDLGSQRMPAVRRWANSHMECPAQPQPVCASFGSRCPDSRSWSSAHSCSAHNKPHHLAQPNSPTPLTPPPTQVDVLREGDGGHEWADGSTYEGSWKVQLNSPLAHVTAMTSFRCQFHIETFCDRAA
jgi:hypothetical protein